jgi:hypothetical protein
MATKTGNPFTPCASKFKPNLKWALCAIWIFKRSIDNRPASLRANLATQIKALSVGYLFDESSVYAVAVS